MPRYYFHARLESGLIRDERGDDLADDEAAWARAVATARILLQNQSTQAQAWQHCVLEVTDENGESVWSVPLAHVAALVAEGALP